MSRPRGARRDSSMATQRRLRLVRHLMRGPATADELIKALKQSLGEDIYPADDHAALRHDMVAVREIFQCSLVYRGGEGYFLTSLGCLTLFELPQEDFEAVALILSAIREGLIPNTRPMAHFCARLLMLMPEEQRIQVQTFDPRLRLAGPVRTNQSVDGVIARLRPALERCEVRFQYRSPYTAEDTVETHRVAPYDFIQRDGMTYLDAYCLESSIPKLVTRTISYRLDRIDPKSIRRLPQQLPPVRYRRQVYPLRYRLGPQIASRRDVALWFEQSTCHYQPDGSMLVEATTTDLWQARQVLLRYREHCVVLEPPELVAMMRESAERMLAVYRDGGGDSYG